MPHWLKVFIWMSILANITVQNNTIANCIFAGIKNHKGHDNIITHNTCFNNGSGLFLQNSTSTVNLINDLKINNNIFIAKANIQCVLRFYSGADDIPALVLLITIIMQDLLMMMMFLLLLHLQPDQNTEILVTGGYSQNRSEFSKITGHDF